jgi:hypothetical protein
MSKKLNSYILPDDVIEEMKNKMREGFSDEIEFGFSLCRNQNSNILKIGEMCTGSSCSVTIPPKCKGNDIYAGAFHTHPYESSRPSSGDVPIFYESGLGCIGGIENNKEEINCYTRKSPKDIEVSFLFKNKLTFITDRIERRKEIDNFVKKNFKITKII